MAPYTGFSKGRCASPGTMILDELDELEAAAAEALLPVPGPVALPQPTESTTVGFDMAALLHAVGGADLETVTSLSLRLLVQDSSLQRLGLCLPSLRHLTLDGSYLVSLRDLGTGMSRLRVLRVTRCSLRSLDGLSCLAGLRELHAAHNALQDIWACAALTHLRVLDLSYTQVRAAGHAGFLSSCGHLRSLSLLGSPAASAGQDYRAEVQRQLPTLQLLDGRALYPASAPSQVSGSESGDDDSGDVDSWLTSSASPAPLSPEQSVPPATQRPASATVSSVAPRELGARRVMSARPRADTGSFHAEGPGDEEAPSGLTSGGVVCGSLAAALRRRPVACWGGFPTTPLHQITSNDGGEEAGAGHATSSDEDKQASAGHSTSSDEGERAGEDHTTASDEGERAGEDHTTPSDEGEQDGERHTTSNIDGERANSDTSSDEAPREQQHEDQLLDSARQWRENYSRFRHENGIRCEDKTILHNAENPKDQE